MLGDRHLTQPPSMGESLTEDCLMEGYQIVDKNLSEDELKILKLLLEHPEGVTIAWLIRVLHGKEALTDKRKYNNARQRLHRLMKKLISKGYVIKIKRGREVIFKLKKDCAVALIDLILRRRSCVSQTCYNQDDCDIKNIYDLCKKKSIEEIEQMDISFTRKLRFKALNIVLNTNELTNEQKSTLISLFEEYVDDVDSKRLIFIDEIGELQVKNYETRFNSERKERKYKRFYRNIWKITVKKYRWGVHATFTINPAKFKDKNLKDIVKIAQKEFNRFFTWLKKVKGRKIEYVRFIEFQGNGRVHYHVIFFGIRSIGNQELIGEKYWRLGFVKARQIVNKRGKWVFIKKPGDYDERYRRYKRLKEKKEFDGGKVMNKDVSVYFYFNVASNVSNPSTWEAMDDFDRLQLALHWALNTRLFTYSSLFSEINKKEEREKLGWKFLGSIYEFELDYLHFYFPLIGGLRIWR